MNCDNCGKGRPKLFTVEGKFCNDKCRNDFLKQMENKFDKFIEKGSLDKNEFQEYETCITEFDNKIK